MYFASDLKHVICSSVQFSIPTDFVVMDVQEEYKIPVLLGRLVLVTMGAFINVKREKLTF